MVMFAPMMGTWNMGAFSMLSVLPTATSMFGGDGGSGGGDAGIGQGASNSELKPVRTSPGGPMWMVMGFRARVNGTVIYSSRIREDKETLKVGSGKSSTSASLYEYSGDIGIGFAAAWKGPADNGKVYNIIRCWAAAKTIYREGHQDKYDHYYDDVEARLGGPSQNPSSILESIKGSGNVWGDRDFCAMIFQDLELDDWGNSWPGNFDCLIQPDDTPFEVGDALKSVWHRVKGRDPDVDMDVSRATGKSTVSESSGEYRFQGLQTEGLVDPLSVIDLIVLAYDLTVQQKEGVLHFIDRGDEDILEVKARDIGCYAGDAPNERPFKMRTLDPKRLPSEVKIGFLNRKQGYHPDIVAQPVNVAPVGNDNVVHVDLPMVFSRKQARRIARRRAYEPYRLRGTIDEFPLPPDYIHGDTGDVWAIPYHGHVYYVLVMEMTIGNNFEVRVRGPVQEVRSGDDPILSSMAGTLGDLEEDEEDPDDESDVPDPEDEDDEGAYKPKYLHPYILNVPPLTDEMAEKAGFLYGQAVEDPEALFKKSQLWWSKKATSGFEKFETMKFQWESTVGLSLEVLPASGARYGYRDLKNALDVQLFEGVPEALTEGELVLVGQEVLRYRSYEALTPVSLSGTTVTLVASTQTITRGTGSWTVDGFKAGYYVRMTGWVNEENNGFFKVKTVGSADMVLEFYEMADEGPVSAPIIEQSSENAYRLTNLTRGLRDTMDHAASPISAGSEVVFLRLNELDWLPINKNKKGKTYWFKPVQKKQVPADVVAGSKVFLNESMRPFRPGHVHFRRYTDAGGDPQDLRIRWVHRSRLMESDPTADELHPLLEKWERYILTIEDSGVTHLRTVKLEYDDHDENKVRQYTYDATAQSADGITPGAEVVVRVYQLGGTVGEGNVTEDYTIPAYDVWMPPTGGIWGAEATEGTVLKVT